jgi:hypothetical protein
MSKVTKKAQAFTIFEEELKNRASGMHDSNKAFRGTVLGRMEAEIGVSRASAATMYNEAKRAAEQDNPNVNLGRDPKKVTVKTTKAPGVYAGTSPATTEDAADEATA